MGLARRFGGGRASNAPPRNSRRRNPFDAAGPRRVGRGNDARRRIPGASRARPAKLRLAAALARCNGGGTRRKLFAVLAEGASCDLAEIRRLRMEADADGVQTSSSCQGGNCEGSVSVQEAVRSSGQGKIGKTDVEYEAVAGAMASGSARASAGPSGLSAEIEGGGMVGARVEGSASRKVGPLTVRATGEVGVGVGLRGHAKVELCADGKCKIDIGLSGIFS